MYSCLVVFVILSVVAVHSLSPPVIVTYGTDKHLVLNPYFNAEEVRRGRRLSIKKNNDRTRRKSGQKHRRRY